MEERKEPKMKENIKQRCQRQSSEGMSVPLLGLSLTGLLFCVNHLCDLPTRSCEQGQLSDLLLPGFHLIPINKISDFNIGIINISYKPQKQVWQSPYTAVLVGGKTAMPEQTMVS